MALPVASPPPQLAYFSPSPPPHPPPPFSPCSTRVSPFFIEKGASFVPGNQVDEKLEKRDLGLKNNDLPQVHEETVMQENMFLETDYSRVLQDVEVKGIKMTRKRPPSLVIPISSSILQFGETEKRVEIKESEVEGLGYYLASKQGKREVMEDGYGVLLNILGNPKQAFFAVIDGHGGRAATDYVAEHLGKNIVKSLGFVGDDDQEGNQVEAAINGGYLDTDIEFLNQGVNIGGACVASVVIRHGDLHVANVGDCRVVLSRNGVAGVLTTDHRLNREDERTRIENSGGYVHCRKGVWRVNGSLAVSRAIGDLHLKKWIISQPDYYKFPITSDCEFLIMASDGLWDKVNDQEAVDLVLRGENTLESCKKLIDMSSSRGNTDDATVMVINVQQFLA